MAVAKQEATNSPSLESVSIVTPTSAKNINGSSSSSSTIATTTLTEEEAAATTMQDHQQKQQQQQQQQVNSTGGGGSNCCASCRMPIKDRFIFSVIEQNFHQDCVRCVDCLSNLNDRCYAFEGKLYCRLDYWRRFGPKCSACQESIKPTELVQRLKQNLIYHLSCFVCQDCKRHLQAGEQLHLIDERRLLCKRDFMITNSCAPNAADLKPSSALINGGDSLAAPARIDAQSVNSPAATRIAAANQQHQDENDQITGRGHHHRHHHHNHSHSHNHHHQLMPTAELNCVPSDEDGDDSALLDELDDQLSSNGLDGDLNTQADLNDGSYAGQYVPLTKGTTGGQVKNSPSMSQDSNQKLTGDEADRLGQRRGPRTTIKPDQLDTLKRAFAQTPKPSRHVREQLANETHLNMRVIQVWFQNRRSKERRMKNSNGNPRRMLYRSSSSRRIRVGAGAAVGTPTANNAGSPLAQQSLMASGGGGGGNRAAAVGGAQQQSSTIKQQHSPMDSKDQQLQLLSGGQQQANANNSATTNSTNNRQSHNSPSEFGGSSSGGFTYFSDSSNQGDAFAINTGASTGQQQQQQQYLPTNARMLGQDQQQTTLMTLESPSNGANTNNNGQRQQQQQYQPMKSEQTPPQAQQSIYPPQLPQQQQQQHMIMATGAPGQFSAGHRGPQQQQSPQHSLNASQIQMEPTLGMSAGLLSHPNQGASVVQW